MGEGPKKVGGTKELVVLKHLMLIMKVAMTIMMIIMVILIIIMTKMTKKHTITVKFE